MWGNFQVAILGWNLQIPILQYISLAEEKEGKDQCLLN